MTPLTLAEIRATIIDATPDMTAALLRDLDWMIRDGFDVRPAPAEEMAFDQERFDMETAQLRSGIRKPGEQSDNWPTAPAEEMDVQYVSCSGHWHAFQRASDARLPFEGPSYASREDAERAVRECEADA